MMLRTYFFLFFLHISPQLHACLCSQPSVRSLYKAVKHRRYAKIVEMLDSWHDLESFNVLQCRMKHREKLWSVENMLFYQGLFKESEIKERFNDEALDFIEKIFRDHYIKNIDWYWSHDPEHNALQIILLRDNVRLFEFLLTYAPAQEFIHSPEGKALCARFAHDKIFNKYQSVFVRKLS